jgi:beta-xylosidase
MKHIYSIIALALLFGSLTAFSQNPIVPPGTYVADPSAHVWDDGKMYLYVSVDESTDYYCSWRYHVLSSGDMKNWTVHKNSFSSKGENDQVPYSDNLLFAPDCMYRNGTYYLYYCLATNQNTEGVATSTSPTGPFVNGENIDVGGYNQIDPAAFIDDDGQAYYVWGQFTAKMAKLKPNMKELDVSTIRDSVLTEGEHFFHEGAYMTKRNGIYYLVYADMSRNGMPTCIGYATSLSPMGPYKYGGVIVDNDNCDPDNWNNHGSIAQFDEKWHVFYHRATHGSRMMRKTCIEPIEFNEDGSIDEVEMTSQGVSEPLDAYAIIGAERACLLFGNVRIQAFSDDNEELGKINNDDRAAYKYLDFGAGAESVTFRVAGGENEGTIVLYKDYPWKKSIATVKVPPVHGKEEWQTITANMDENIEGEHALWMKFFGEGDELFSIDWFRFNK